MTRRSYPHMCFQENALRGRYKFALACATACAGEGLLDIVQLVRPLVCPRAREGSLPGGDLDCLWSYMGGAASGELWKGIRPTYRPH